MIFGACPLSDAQGAILAHTLRLPARTLKKGLRLTAGDLRDIAAAGHETIVAARLERGDVDEDKAAEVVARGIAKDGLRLSAPRTGRCNLIAREAGLLVVDTAAIDAMNAVDEAITVATLRPFAPVSAGEVVATVKIIPFAVPGERLRAVVDFTDGSAPLAVRPFAPASVGLVSTRVAGGRERLLDKARDALAARLTPLGSTLTAERRCKHDASDVAAAITALIAQGCSLVAVSGAAATVDRADVVPGGIAAAGGEVLHFGMPVEPGNLLVLGRVGCIPVVGMPGCARSVKTNGFDWVLARLLARLDVTGADIMSMGVGGLLGETPARFMRLEKLVREDAASRLVTDRPRVAAIILAAGASRRMGETNKLLADVDGKALVAHAADAALASRAAPVIVVSGHERAAVEHALAGRDVRFVHAEDHGRGMSASLRSGISAVGEDTDGAVVLLGDMPGVTAEHVDRLVAAFDPLADAAICVATDRGKRGHPVLWARQFFAEMMAIEGDVGARGLLRRYDNLIEEVEMDDRGVMLDIDRPEDLAALKARVTTD